MNGSSSTAGDGPIPRLPVFGWQALAGRRRAPIPCVLDRPGSSYTTSGRASILLALETLGIAPGDGVLLPSYHCPTMVAPAVSLGAVPVFYPIGRTGAPDLAWLESQGQNLGHVRALLAAHYFGLPQPMHELRSWCDARRIALIEDCAHALFGCSGQRPIGGWGDVAIVSLTKFLPVPAGGCLILNRPGDRTPQLTPSSMTSQMQAAVDILEVGAVNGRLRGLNTLIAGALAALRRARPGASRRHGRGTDDEDRLLAEADAIGKPASGANMHIDSSLAHRALTQPCRWVARALPRQRIVQRRRRNYDQLARLLTGLPGLRPLQTVLPPDCAPYVFPLWLDDPDPGYSQLRRLAMPVFRWDRLWPTLPKRVGDHGRLWSHHVIQLACHQDLTEKDLDRMAATIRHIYAKAAAPIDHQAAER